jgi:hypothetical protein
MDDQTANAKGRIVATDRAEFLARSVPASARGIVERAFTGKASPRAAVKAKCLDCSGYDRAEVAACTVILCPLHAYRPFQESRRKPRKTDRESEFSDALGAGTRNGR